MIEYQSLSQAVLGFASSFSPQFQSYRAGRHTQVKEVQPKSPEASCSSADWPTPGRESIMPTLPRVAGTKIGCSNEGPGASAVQAPKGTLEGPVKASQ